MNNDLLSYFNGDELAARVWLNKYAAVNEVTPRDMHKRMAKEFYRIEKKYQKNELNKSKLSDYGRSRRDLTEKDIFDLFNNFKYVIPQGSVMSQLGTPSMGSLSNCFVVKAPYDSYGGIIRTDEELAQLFKRRCGVGTDISTLRPNGTSTSNVAKTSTGAVSFMERFSNTTREVAQGGRRGALMLSIDINHPDIMEFIKVKKDLTKVTGANISVRVNNDFMKAVENDEDYILRWPCNKDLSKYSKDYLDSEYNDLYYVEDKTDNSLIHIKKVKAKDVWNELISSAHASAEPGILFWDNVLDAPDSAYRKYSPISTNPCGEIPLPEDDSCRLIALNLTSFVKKPYTEKATFDYEKFSSVVYEALRLNDDLVDLEIEAIDKIIDKIENDAEPDDVKAVELNLWKRARQTGKNSRRTGLGFTGLGDTLAMMGYDYNQHALPFIDSVMTTKLKTELDCSVDMAITRGYFEGWKPSLEYVKHYTGQNRFDYVGVNNFYSNIMHEFPEQVNRMLLYGRRNVSWSTVAPTGSLSMLAQVTSGIEPLFQPFYIRRKKINIGDDKSFKADFIDDVGDQWTEHAVIHEEFRNWYPIYQKMLKDEGYDDAVKDIPIDELTKDQLNQVFASSPWSKSTANDIHWKDRVEIQAMVQEYTTHSISSTINLPKDVDVDVVNNIYLQAWAEGLKGVTVYRDGSRDGVLINETEKKDNKFEYAASLKRPKNVEGFAHTVKISGERYSVFVGLIDGIPYEVFAYKGGTTEGPGVIFKEGKGQYYFIGEGDEARNRILSGKMSDEQEAFTRLISGSLRHGRDIKYIVADLQKTSGNMFSFNAAIAKVLKKYIPNGEKSSAKCLNPECSGDGTNVIFEEGCNKCLDCGSSACG